MKILIDCDYSRRTSWRTSYISLSSSLESISHELTAFMDLFEQLSSLFTPASENSPALLDGDCKQSVLGQYICCDTTVILLRYHWLLLVNYQQFLFFHLDEITYVRILQKVSCCHDLDILVKLATVLLNPSTFQGPRLMKMGLPIGASPL